MEISAQQVKELRDRTNAGMMQCKKALEQTGGDIDKAVEYLRKEGIAQAEKKMSRTASEGVIASYIHPGSKLGVLCEVNCETDFVAKNDVFKDFVKDITLQIAASNPKYLRREDVPADVLEKEKEIIRAQIKNKPANVIEKIVEGKIVKFFSEACLLDQPFVKDSEMTVEQYTKLKISELGEKLSIRRFVRFSAGESL
jgi:elongation factor Ts